MNAIPKEWLKTAVMNPLQQQLAEKGRCPGCKGVLLYMHTGAGIDFHQCGRCNHVYALPEVPKLIG